MPELKKTKVRKRKKKLKVQKSSPKLTKPKPDIGSEEVAAKESKGPKEERDKKGLPVKKDKVGKKRRRVAAKVPEEGAADKLGKPDTITLNYKALNKVLRHGMRFSSPHKPRKDWVECMGFLIGDVNDGSVEIKDAIPVVHGSLVEVEFRDEHYSKADQINQILTDDNWVVGWYHTHPGHGLFLSAVDKINHSGYQSLNPKAVALVFDPSKFVLNSTFKDYIKIFRLKDPGLRAESDFLEVENVKITHTTQEVIGSFYEASLLHSKDFPLVLEYGEDYKKPEVVSVTTKSKEAEGVENDIKEMQKLIRNMSRAIKHLNGKLESHTASTARAIEELRQGKAVIKPKERRPRKDISVCEFCGYDSIMPGDTTCASCGKRL